jgi:hypothetical protein
MSGRNGLAAEVLWSQEGSAWIGVLGETGNPVQGARESAPGGFEVELLLRAEGWHVEMSHTTGEAFECEHIEAEDPEEARAKAADLLCAFIPNPADQNP